MTKQYDLIVIGAGSGGLTAAHFAQQVGASVALIEKDRIGGDCTWTGCVPSKALLKAAGVAHQVRAAGQFGIFVGQPAVDMEKVRDYIRQVIDTVYQYETPEYLLNEGIDVIPGKAQFNDAHTVQVGSDLLTARKFIVATGARPFIPPIPGLDQVPYLTYEKIFENDRLPSQLLIIGAGPIGTEIAQAYQRLGSQVTLIDVDLLPREEPEVAEVLGRVMGNEGVRFVKGLVSEAREADGQILLTVNEQELKGDQLLVAAGRTANVDSLNLDRAGVDYSELGIPVDKYLRTNQAHIYAAGDCVAGNHQFTHVAGWQAVQAARNALLPLNDAGFTNVVPWTTFTDPEVAHVGLTEAAAREKWGDAIQVSLWPIERIDRAVTDHDREGFVKVVYLGRGTVLGATIIAARAGEMITEFALAMKNDLKLIDLANTLHVYPTYSIANMQLAGDVAVQTILDSLLGKIVLGWAGLKHREKKQVLRASGSGLDR